MNNYDASSRDESGHSVELDVRPRQENLNRPYYINIMDTSKRDFEKYRSHVSKMETKQSPNRMIHDFPSRL